MTQCHFAEALKREMKVTKLGILKFFERNLGFAAMLIFFLF